MVACGKGVRAPSNIEIRQSSQLNSVVHLLRREFEFARITWYRKICGVRP